VVDPYEKLAEQLPFEFPGFVECGYGWFSIINDLCNRIKDLGIPKGFRVAQVKQKFGQLCFYVDNSNKEIDKAIEYAERLADRTCEECGSLDDVTTNSKGWIDTLCYSCRKAE